MSAAALAFVNAENLACVRGGRMVFRDLSFQVNSGKMLVLEGPNGSGKTSTLRMLAGLLPQAEGAIRLQRAGGQEVTDGEERGKFVAWLGHQDGIKAQLSVLENAKFFAALFAQQQYVSEALDGVGLSRAADLPAAYLSAGQRRRLALTRLLLSKRPLWLLDEPMAALDADGRALVTRLVGDHCAAGGIAIASSHEKLAPASVNIVLVAP